MDENLNVLSEEDQIKMMRNMLEDRYKHFFTSLDKSKYTEFASNINKALTSDDPSALRQTLGQYILENREKLTRMRISPIPILSKEELLVRKVMDSCVCRSIFSCVGGIFKIYK